MDFLSRWIRVATDLIVRVGRAGRAQSTKPDVVDPIKRRQALAQADVNETPTAFLVREEARQASQELLAIGQALERRDVPGAMHALKRIEPRIAEIRTMADTFGNEAMLWRVLASLGTELAAFVHEVNSLALEASALVGELDGALRATGANATLRASLTAARGRALDLADRIRRNAAYLVDATSMRGRRRRTRFLLAETVSAVLRSFSARISSRRIALRDDVPADLHTPPMYPAEMSAILVNLLSNAVKFSGDGGTIRIVAGTSQTGLFLLVENSGAAVDRDDSERLFAAFVSTTDEADESLGQGMGLGLTITRALVGEYGGTIAFVQPSTGYATAVRVEIPEPRR